MQNVRILLAAAAIVLCAPAQAQILGSGDTTRIVTPFSAGGAVDRTARVIADQASQISGNPVIVENHGGAGGEIGVKLAAGAPPDGKTVLFHTSSHVIVPAYRGKAEEIAAQFEPLVRLGAVKFVLAVRADLPAKNIKEFIELGKSGSGLTYGSTGPGTTLHIAGEMTVDQLGIKAVHVPYKGLGPVFNDLVAGHIDFVVTSVTGVLPHEKGGRLRTLAVLDEERAEEMPDVPTTVELGFKELLVTNWYGLFVHADVPAETRSKLESLFLQTANSPKVKEILVNSGLHGIQPASEFKKFVDADFKRWPATLKRLGISAK